MTGTANILACGLPTVFTSTTSHTITASNKAREAAGECVFFSATENHFVPDLENLDFENFDPPRNKYGRTKREAEKLCLLQALSRSKSFKSNSKSCENGVVILRAPRFFCEDLLEEGAPPIEKVMAIELLGRRAALVFKIFINYKIKNFDENFDFLGFRLISSPLT